MAEQLELNRSDLRTIAIYQKAILVCILFQLLAVLGQVALPPESRFILAIGSFGVSIVSTVFVFLLATKVSSTAMGIVQGILTLIPCIGLIVLLVINQKTTATLQRHGIRVGLLGASLSDLK